jgi:hypothetical protein
VLPGHEKTPHAGGVAALTWFLVSAARQGGGPHDSWAQFRRNGSAPATTMARAEPGQPCYGVGIFQMPRPKVETYVYPSGPTSTSVAIVYGSVVPSRDQ